MDFNKLKNWIIDKWLAGFISGGIWFLAKLYFDMPVEQKGYFFNYQWFWNLMNVGIKAWQVLIFFFAIIFFHQLQVNRIRRGTKAYIKPKNPFEQYKRDAFGPYQEKWSWDYYFDTIREQFQIRNLHPLCPTCEAPMEVEPYNPQNAICQKCRLEHRIFQKNIKTLEVDVNFEIRRRIINGEIRLS